MGLLICATTPSYDIIFQMSCHLIFIKELGKELGSYDQFLRGKTLNRNQPWDAPDAGISQLNFNSFIITLPYEIKLNTVEANRQEFPEEK